VVPLVSAIASFLSIIAIPQFLSGKPAAGTMVNPNILAGYLVMAIPLVLGMLMISAPAPVRRAYKIALFLTVACLLLTGSAAGIISAFLVSLSVIYKEKGMTFLKEYRRLLLAGLVIAALIVILKSGEAQVENRIVWWKTAVRMIMHRPLLGVGAGNFASSYLRYRSGGLNSLYAHNFFLQLASETGLPSLLAFLCFLLMLFARKGNVSMQAGLAGVLIHNVLDYNLAVPANAVLFWVMAGMALRSPPAGPVIPIFEKRLDRNEKRILNVVTAILIAGSAMSVSKPFLASRHMAFGNIARREQKLDRSEDEYMKAVGLDAMNPLAYFSLSELYLIRYGEDRYESWLDEAIIELNEAIRCQHDYAPFHGSLAFIYRLKRDYKKSMGEMKKAISLDRHNREYPVSLIKLTELAKESP